MNKKTKPDYPGVQPDWRIVIFGWFADILSSSFGYFKLIGHVATFFSSRAEVN